MKRNNLYCNLLLAIASLTVTAQAQNNKNNQNAQAITITPEAQDIEAINSTQVIELDAITIMGNNSNTIDNTLPNVDVINLSTLRNPRVTNFKDAIVNNPAIEINSSGNGQAQSLYVRGLGENYTELTLDGQKMPVFFTFGPYTSGGRDFIETDTIKQIDIVKGLASPKQQTGALAGSVNMQSYDPSDFVDKDNRYYFSFRPVYTSKNKGFGGSATIAGNNDNLNGMLIYSYRNYHELQNKGSNATKTLHDKQNIEQHNILAKGEIQLNDGRLLFTGEYFDRQNDITARYPADIKKVKTNTEPTTRARIAAKGEFFNTLGIDKLEVEASGQLFKQSIVMYGTSDYQQKNISLKVDAAKKLSFGNIEHNLLFGTGYDFYNYDYSFSSSPTNKMRYLPITDKHKFSVYAKDQLIFNNGFTITPGIRIEHDKLSSKIDQFYLNNPALASQSNYIPEDNSTAISPSINATMPIGNNTKLFASYARGIKQVDNANMGSFDHGFGFIIPNPNLKTEKSNNYELGVNYILPQQFEFKLTAFYNQFSDFIDYKRDGVFGTYKGKPKSILRPFNINDVKTYGSELEIGYHFNENFYAHGAFAWMKGKIGNSSSHGVVLSQAYPQKAILGIDYNQENKWGAAIDWTLVGKGQKPENPKKEFRTPGYGSIDLTAWWNPIDNLTMTAGIYNVTDKKYWLSADANGLNKVTKNGTPINLDNYTQPGRNYALSLIYEF